MGRITEDCKFMTENEYFRYRAGGFLIHDGKMLFVKSDFGGGYYYVIGGAVRLNETSQACIEREIFEETGIEAKAERLAVVCENFFLGDGGCFDGKDCHVLEFYYILKADDIKNFKEETDEGEKLCWIPLEEVGKSIIKPSFVPERIDEILNADSILHVVEDREKRKA